MVVVKHLLIAGLLIQAADVFAGNLTFSPENKLTHDFPSNPKLRKYDIDKDGDMDFTACNSYSSFPIGWFENKGDGRLTQHDMDPEMTYAFDNVVGDINKDGNLDMMVYGNVAGIVWYESLKNGKAWTRHDLANPGRANSLAIIDVDGDGKKDAVFADDNISWYRNEDGKGGKWSTERVLVKGKASDLGVADMDKDGDEDLVAIKDGELVVLTNNKGNFTPKIAYKESSGYGIGDADRDGYPDLVSTSGADIHFVESVDGKAYSATTLHDSSNIETRNVELVDMDNDGDLDIVTSLKPAPSVFLNNGGKWTEQVIYKDNDKSDKFVYAMDLNGDKKQDILTFFPNSSKVHWVQNTSSIGTPKVASAPKGATKAAPAKAAPAKAAPKKKK